MKGSAITGPVAKECVSILLYFFCLPRDISHPCSRPTYGLVLRRTQAQWSRLFIFSVSFAAPIVMPCISKMPLHLHT